MKNEIVIKPNFSFYFCYLILITFVLTHLSIVISMIFTNFEFTYFIYALIMLILFTFPLKWFYKVTKYKYILKIDGKKLHCPVLSDIKIFWTDIDNIRISYAIISNSHFGFFSCRNIM